MASQSSLERPTLGENAFMPLNSVFDDFTNRCGMRALADDSSTATSQKEAAMLLMTAETHADEADFEACLTAAKKSLSLFREAGDKTSAADALGVVVKALRLKAESSGERPDEALKVVTEELAAFAKNKDTRGAACMQLALAELYAGMTRGGKDLKKARDSADDAVESFGQLKDKKMAAKAHLVLMNIKYQMSLSEDTFDQANSAMELSKEAGDRLGEAKALHGVALSYAMIEEYDTAVSTAQDALTIYQELGEKRSEAFELQTMAQWYLGAKKPWKAVVAAKEAYAIHCGLKGSVQGEAVALLMACTAMIANSRERQAVKLAKKGLERFQAAGDKAGVAAGFEVLLHTHMALGNAREAFKAAEEALDIVKAMGCKRLEINLIHAVCKVRMACGFWDEALDSMREVLDLSEDLDDEEEEAMALRMMAFINICSGGVKASKDVMSDALQCCADARYLFKKSGYTSGEASMCLIAATLKDSNSDVLKGAKEAQKMYTEAADVEGESATLKLIIDAYLVDKNYNEAMTAANSRMELWKRAGKKSMQAEAMHKIASIHLKKDEIDEAEEAILTARTIAQEVNEKGLESALLLLLVQVYLQKMSKEQIPKDIKAPMPDTFLSLRRSAYDVTKDAISLAAKENDRDLQAAAQFWRSEMLIWAFQPVEAMNYAETAEKIFAGNGNVRGQVHSKVLYADLLNMVGEKSRALTAANKALELAQSMGEAFEEEDVAKAMITKLSAKPAAAKGGKKGKKGKKPKKAKKSGGGGKKTKMVKKMVSKGGSGRKKDTGLDLATTRTRVLALVKAVTTDDEDIDNDQPFMEAGIDSLGSVQLVTDMGKEFGMALSPSAIFDFPTIAQIADHLVEESGGGGGGDDAGGDEMVEQWVEVEVDDDDDDGDDDDESSEEEDSDDDGGAQAADAGDEPAASVAIVKKKAVEEKKGFDPVVTQTRVMKLVKEVVASDEELDIDSPLMEAGVDSLGSVQLVTDLSKEFSMPLSPSAIFDFPTVKQLVEHLVEESNN